MILAELKLWSCRNPSVDSERGLHPGFISQSGRQEVIKIELQIWSLAYLHAASWFRLIDGAVDLLGSYKQHNASIAELYGVHLNANRVRILDGKTPYQCKIILQFDCLNQFSH